MNRAVGGALLAALCVGVPARASDLLYELPAAGSYELPPIERVRDRPLLGADGTPDPILGLAPGQCALIAFVYLSCTDASGCPLSLAALQRVDRAVAARDDLRGRVRLVTVSFDPARDGPAEMAMLRHHMAPKGDWRFLTAAGPGDLQPVLEDFGQDAVPAYRPDGESSAVIAHVTKVFLVDERGDVRNVYSSGFLEPRLLVRDAETVLGIGSPAGGD